MKPYGDKLGSRTQRCHADVRCANSVSEITNKRYGKDIIRTRKIQHGDNTMGMRVI